MTETTAWIRLLLVRELETFEREILLFPSDGLAWATMPGVKNSAGNLALHVCGNLQHYLGNVLGGTGFVRDRDAEFSRRDVPRTDLVRDLRAAIAVVDRVLPSISVETLSRAYPEQVGGTSVPTGLVLLQLEAHLAHHLGQVGYLRRVLTGEDRSSGPVAIKALGASAPPTA